tara:strand:+ start:139 stop:732 length:594 start_codon:yes stop_codon:yes gene_type:complete
MHIVGLTGGIGTGKSVVANLFIQLSIPVYNSDLKAKWLMNNISSLKSELIDAFGSKTYVDESIDKSYLSGIVFQNPEKLKTINTIVHPYVKIDFEDWVKNSKAPYVVKEAAILIESGAYKQVDSILLVQAELEKRIKRVTARDGVLKKDVVERIENQLSEKEKQKYADYTISNNGSLEELALKVKDIHKTILKSIKV